MRLGARRCWLRLTKQRAQLRIRKLAERHRAAMSGLADLMRILSDVLNHRRE